MRMWVFIWLWVGYFALIKGHSLLPFIAINLISLNMILGRVNNICATC